NGFISQLSEFVPKTQMVLVPIRLSLNALRAMILHFLNLAETFIGVGKIPFLQMLLHHEEQCLESFLLRRLCDFLVFCVLFSEFIQLFWASTLTLYRLLECFVEVLVVCSDIRSDVVLISVRLIRILPATPDASPKLIEYGVRKDRTVRR